MKKLLIILTVFLLSNICFYAQSFWFIDQTKNNVDNTSDANKPVSTAQQNSLDKKIDNTNIIFNTTSKTFSGRNPNNYNKYSTIIDPRQSIIISKFDGGVGTEWIKYGAGGTVTDDTTIFKTSNKSIKFVSTGTTDVADGIKTATYNLSGYTNLFYRFYVSDYNDINHVLIMFTSGATTRQKYLDNMICTGWNTIALGQWQITGALDWSNITQIRMQFTAKAGKTLTVYMDELTAYKPTLDKGVVILHFDDGNDDAYTTARKRLDKYNYPGNVSIVGDLIGDNGRMTIQQMKDIQNINKWDVFSHGWGHINLDNVSTSTAETDFQTILKILQENGIINTGVFSYPYNHPYGDSTDVMMDLVSKYYSLAAGTDYPVGSYGLTEPFPFASPLRLRGYIVQNADAVNTLLGYVDEAITNKSVSILIFHHINASFFSEAKFTAFVDSLYIRDIEVGTYSGLLKKYYNKFELDERYVKMSSGTASFDSTAAIDTVLISDASVDDIYSVSWITKPAAGDGCLSYTAIATGIIVERLAGTTSGASYAWRREKR